MSELPRIDQILPTFGYYDAIGIDNRNIRDLIRSRGFASDIFAEDGIVPKECRPLAEYEPYKAKKNLLIHHFSIGSLLPYYLMNACSTKITRYHNITPAKYFPYPHAAVAKSKCRQGRLQFKLLNDLSDYYWADSSYNASELDQHNFKNGSVLPLMRNYKRLLQVNPCDKVTRFLARDKRKTILFVGRVTPNKAHHDLLFLLKQYFDYVDDDVRLVCVGQVDNYYGKVLLKELARDWGLRASFYKPYHPQAEIIFTGSVNDHELVSFYRSADVFVCMSDHEGFCVPLVEAMNFQLPILAHKAAAVPETLGQGGLLVDKHSPAEVLRGLVSLLHDKPVRAKYQNLACQRGQDFDWQVLEEMFYSKLDAVLAKHLAS